MSKKVEITFEELADKLYEAEMRGLKRGWGACAQEAFLTGMDDDLKLAKRNPFRDDND